MSWFKNVLKEFNEFAVEGKAQQKLLHAAALSEPKDLRSNCR
jgi:hypothetical protein